jgi:hypothetical protein
MEIVDMGITRFWIWGRKSRSVYIFSQRSNLGLLWLIFNRFAQSAGLAASFSGFVFVSCVRASGRGEAAWARERRYVFHRWWSAVPLKSKIFWIIKNNWTRNNNNTTSQQKNKQLQSRCFSLTVVVCVSCSILNSKGNDLTRSGQGPANIYLYSSISMLGLYIYIYIYICVPPCPAGLPSSFWREYIYT